MVREISSHFETKLNDYSEEIVYGRNADFSDIYPVIHQFIELVVSWATSKMK